jgi:hypothetical protein
MLQSAGRTTAFFSSECRIHHIQYLGLCSWPVLLTGTKSVTSVTSVTSSGPACPVSSAFRFISVQQLQNQVFTRSFQMF